VARQVGQAELGEQRSAAIGATVHSSAHVLRPFGFVQ
jgi:hypothetical protein